MNNIQVTATLNDLISSKLNNIIKLTQKLDNVVLKLGKDMLKISNVKFDGLLNSLNKVDNKLSSINNKASKSKSKLSGVGSTGATGKSGGAGSTIAGGLGGAGGMIGGLALGGIAVAGAGIAILGKNIISTTADLEQNQIAFTTMLQSAEKAKTLMADIKKLEAQTPLTTSDLNNSAKTLLAYGITLESIIPTQRMLGDVSLGNKDKFDRLNLAYGQTMAKGRLMGQEVLQMVETGFNPLKVISETTGESMLKLTKRMEKGGISANEVTKAFQKVTSEGGMFYKAMESQSKSLAGLWSTFSSKLESIFGQIGMKLMPAFKGVVSILSDSMDYLMKNIDFNAIIANATIAFNWIKTNAVPVFIEIKDWVLAIGANFSIWKEQLMFTLEPIFSILNSVGKLFSIFGAVGDKVSFIAGVFNTLIVLGKILTAPIWITLKIFTSIIDVLVTLYVTWVKWVTHFEVVKKIISSVGDFVTALKNGIMDAFKWMSDIYDLFIEMITYDSPEPDKKVNNDNKNRNAYEPGTSAGDILSNLNIPGLTKPKKGADSPILTAEEIKIRDKKDKEDKINNITKDAGLTGSDTNLKTDRSITNVTLSINKVIDSGGIVITTQNITESSTEISNIVETALIKALTDATNIKLKK